MLNPNNKALSVLRRLWAERLAILIALLCLGAVVWVIVDHAAYTSCLVIIGAAAVLAYIGRNDW